MACRSPTLIFAETGLPPRSSSISTVPPTESSSTSSSGSNCVT